MNRHKLKKFRKLYPFNTGKNPLVSVVIPTYNKGRILVERAINSVLRQTYQNVEVIVIGDHCTDETETLIKKIGDPRIVFYNLARRGKYPNDPRDRWFVAGVEPANKAIDIASGEWLAPLDDDDEFSEDHIESLLSFALEHGYEMVYGITLMEKKPDIWEQVGEYPLQSGKICHLSVLYHKRLKFIKYRLDSWKYGEPADWNRWRRMMEAGAKIGFLPKVVGKHYLEGTRKGI